MIHYATDIDVGGTSSAGEVNVVLLGIGVFANKQGCNKENAVNKNPLLGLEMAGFAIKQQRDRFQYHRCYREKVT